VHINDRLVTVSCKVESAEKDSSGVNQVYTLAMNKYFVIGDDLDTSVDSRAFGPVDCHRIIGKAWLAVGYGDVKILH